ncbi:fluoride efflux transporter CrcB [Roseateles koreensis]|uniref:Fluoride-specific ion channel FluC n=1 Tax=Roseateles koreensis TaxID=2987526 RepID=A0ABT5KLN8_9BURK|nr:fluoride efflux transporter CrcB [Roseateles koreensis]MDC8783766.1 fluoride efflux transporter CrcB [Roseateles koreensis]
MNGLIMKVLAVSCGASGGALLRWRLGLAFNASWAGFPLGTLTANLVGGLLIGVALEWFGRTPNELLQLLMVTGFLGGLTTFSAFSGESLLLLQRGHYEMALLHSGVHVLGALTTAALGMRLAQWLL